MKYFSTTVLAILFILFVQAQPGNRRLLDQPIGITTAKIEIDAGFFTTKTFMELEFCNTHAQEMEGLYRFRLEHGQVITGFQLELNGRFRDGSIEERWKATNAYNSIVGKRVDPAILSMEYADNYRLNVYPIPAGGCRKVTITIEQANDVYNALVKYSLPMVSSDTVKNLTVNVTAPEYSFPSILSGQLKGNNFSKTTDAYMLAYKGRNIKWNLPIEFSFQRPFTNIVCANNNGTDKSFMIFAGKNVPKTTRTDASSITVCWDASASLRNRDVVKEMDFLRQVLSYHNTERLTIVRFNYRVLDSATFYFPNKSFAWQQYLSSTNYSGATQLGCIDLSKNTSDIVLLFTDGINTYGKKMPNTGMAKVYCITTAANADMATLNAISGQSGGAYISLLNKKVFENIKETGITKNWLMNIRCTNGRLVTNTALPKPIDNGVLVSGEAEAATDTLLFEYGTNSKINFVEKIALNVKSKCGATSLKRYDLLQSILNYTSPQDWAQAYSMGIREKIVTQYTSFIVLEKTEDYIRYNIAPPKELEEECAQKGYVKIYQLPEREKKPQYSSTQILNNVAMVYRQRLGMQYKPVLAQQMAERREASTGIEKDKTVEVKTNNVWEPAGKTSGFNMSRELEDVVITSAYSIKRSARSLTYSSQVVRSEQLNIAREANINNALAGKVAGVQVRSQATANLGRETTVRLRGENGITGSSSPLYVVDGTVTNSSSDINADDIEDITVLQGPAATALFGPEGSNGAIVINLKKGKRTYVQPKFDNYKLKDMDDMDYLKEMKSTDKFDKYSVYQKYMDIYESDEAFHYDVAMHFFECGMRMQAEEALMNAVEASKGNTEMLIAAAYMYDKWKDYNSAIKMYEAALNSSNSLTITRSLAWAYFNAGRPQEAVDIIFNALGTSLDNMENEMMPVKLAMLSDMNAMIAMAKDRIDISAIPEQMIVPDSADYRVVVEFNFGDFRNIAIKEPSALGAVKTSMGINVPHNNYWGSYLFEYKQPEVKHGKYSMSIPFYAVGTGYYAPYVFRKTVYKNYGKANQTTDSELIVMDNQYGNVEMTDWVW